MTAPVTNSPLLKTPPVSKTQVVKAPVNVEARELDCSLYLEPPQHDFCGDFLRRDKTQLTDAYFAPSPPKVSFFPCEEVRGKHPSFESHCQTIEKERACLKKGFPPHPFNNDYRSQLESWERTAERLHKIEAMAPELRKGEVRRYIQDGLLPRNRLRQEGCTICLGLAHYTANYPSENPPYPGLKQVCDVLFEELTRGELAAAPPPTPKPEK